jgi:tetratricopeptide (TPR) repeat protein
LLGEPDANTPTGQAEVRWRLLIAREATFFLQARRDEQAVDLGALERLADAMDDDRRRAEVACRVAGRAVRMADWAALKKAAKYALDCASREGDINLRLRALYFLATALEHEGDLAGSNALAVRGLDEARQAGLRGVEVRFLQSLSGAAESRGEYAVALELNRQQLLILREIGNRIDEAVCQQNVGSSLLNLGDLAEAQRALEAALQLMRANDDRVMEGSALGHLSEVALLRGDAIHAQALAKQALDITLETKSRWEQLFAAVRLGDAETALGRRPEARSAYTHALEVAQAINDPTMYDAATGLAGVALAEGDLGAALAALEPVLSAVSAGGTLHGSLRPRLIELTCHLVLARADDARAPQWLQRAHTALMAQADAISDAALRYGFLNNIPWHREIAAAWADLSRGASPTRDLGNAESAPT